MPSKISKEQYDKLKQIKDNPELWSQVSPEVQKATEQAMKDFDRAQTPVWTQTTDALKNFGTRSYDNLIGSPLKFIGSTLGAMPELPGKVMDAAKFTMDEPGKAAVNTLNFAADTMPIYGPMIKAGKELYANRDKPMGPVEGAATVGGAFLSPMLGPDTKENLLGLTNPDTVGKSVGTLAADVGQYAMPGPKTKVGKIFNRTVGAPALALEKTVGKATGAFTKGIMDASVRDVTTPGGRKVRIPGFKQVTQRSAVAREREFGDPVKAAEMEKAIPPLGSTGLSAAESAMSRLRSSPTSRSKLHEMDASNAKAVTEELQDLTKADSLTPEEVGKPVIERGIENYEGQKRALGREFDDMEAEFAKVGAPVLSTNTSNATGPGYDAKGNLNTMSKAPVLESQGRGFAEHVVHSTKRIREKWIHEIQGSALDRILKKHALEPETKLVDKKLEDGTVTQELEVVKDPDTGEVSYVPKENMTLLDLRKMYKELANLLTDTSSAEFGKVPQARAEVFQLLGNIRETVKDALKDWDPQLAKKWEVITEKYSVLADEFRIRQAAGLEPSQAIVAGTQELGSRKGAAGYVERYADPNTPAEGRRATKSIMNPAARESLLMRGLRDRMARAWMGMGNPLTKPKTASQVTVDPSGHWEGKTLDEVIQEYDRNGVLEENLDPHTVDDLREIVRIASDVEPGVAAALNQTQLAVSSSKKSGVLMGIAEGIRRYAYDIPYVWLLTNPKAIKYVRKAYEFMEKGNVRLMRAAMTAAQKQIEQDQNRDSVLLGEEETSADVRSAAAPE